MRYSYGVTYRDFVAAQRLHMNHTPRVKWTVLIFLRILPAVGIVASVALLAGLIHPSNLEFVILCGFIGAGAWGLVMAVLRPFGFKRLYKQMKNGRPEDELCELELMNGQLISRVPGVSEGRFMPAAIRNFVEDDKIALLYVAPKRFLMIPKHTVDEEGLQKLRAWRNGVETRRAHAD